MVGGEICVGHKQGIWCMGIYWGSLVAIWIGSIGVVYLLPVLELGRYRGILLHVMLHIVHGRRCAAFDVEV